MTLQNNQLTRVVRVSLAAFVVLIAISPSPVRAAGLGGGQGLYLAHCAGCHGQNGISTMPAAPNLASVELFSQPDQVLADVVRSGRDTMPPFLGILNDREILDVIRYVRTLR